MKRLLFALILLPLFFLPSCVKDEENLFDGSAAERMTRALNDYSRILNEAPNGWIMEYYSRSVGGYVYLCKFQSLEGQLNGSVTVASELEDAEYPTGTTVTSLYELKQDQSAVLTFNTYNPLLHYFSEPSSANRNGLGGDYEFTVIKADADSVIMRGKKHGDRIVMTPFEGSDWNLYLQAIGTLKEQSEYAYYHLYVNGKLVCPAAIEENKKISFALGNESIEQRFIFTDGGMNLYDPVIVKGVKFQFFEWDQANQVFRCTEPGTDVVLALSIPSFYLNYEDFNGTYRFEYNEYTNTGRISRTVTVTEKEPGKTYTLSGACDFDIEMKYSRRTGLVGIYAQNMGEYQGNTVLLCVWSLEKETLIYDPTYWYAAKWNGDRNNFILTFEDSRCWPGYPIDALILYMGNNSGWLGTYPIMPNRFMYITMTKQ